MESKLQFKRRHAENSSSIETEVDWEEVERTLKEVDPEGTFSDPRFDPLKHALRILGSVAAEKDLNEASFRINISTGFLGANEIALIYFFIYFLRAVINLSLKSFPRSYASIGSL
jgi:hypothetical protein